MVHTTIEVNPKVAAYLAGDNSLVEQSPEDRANLLSEAGLVVKDRIEFDRLMSSAYEFCDLYPSSLDLLGPKIIQLKERGRETAQVASKNGRYPLGTKFAGRPLQAFVAEWSSPLGRTPEREV